MNEMEFTNAFREVIEKSINDVEIHLGKALSRDVVIKVYGLDMDGVNMSPEKFIEIVYINGESSYRVIDIMVVELRGNRPVIFARVSGHAPAPYSMSWNGEKGPFKQLIAENVVQK